MLSDQHVCKKLPSLHRVRVSVRVTVRVAVTVRVRIIFRVTNYGHCCGKC